MLTENKIAEPAPNLATGASLNATTWADFVQRLRHDCVGGCRTERPIGKKLTLAYQRESLRICRDE